MKTWEALLFTIFFSYLWIEICKTITFGYKSQKGRKASFEFNVVVDIFFSFKILNHKSRFVVVYICFKIDVTAIINFGHFFLSAAKRRGFKEAP